MLALAALLLAAPTAYKVDPNIGSSNFAAVFDAQVGERIVAMSGQVACSFEVDEAAGTASGSCSVPLTSIDVDHIDRKTEHFQEWATNKKGKPKACTFEAKFEKAALKLEANKEVPFIADASFTLCGRAREDGAKEKVEGTALLLPAGSYGDATTVRIRAKVAKFNREAYHVGPKWTDGWLARVQQLAPVVASEGEVTLSLFARQPEDLKPVKGKKK